MKNVKIMLLSLALIAVVGGALAFKAKIGTKQFCTAEPYENTTIGLYCTYDLDPGPGVDVTAPSCEIFHPEAEAEGNVTVVCTSEGTDGCLEDTCPDPAQITTDN